MRNKILSLLVLLLTAASGAWAQDPNAVTAAEINSELYSGWSSIDGKLLKASELPGFQAVTEDQAKSWTGVPSTGKVWLYYKFVADGNVKVIEFENGVYVSSFEEKDLRCYDIYEDIAYNGDKKYFYTTGPAADPNAVEVTTNAASEGATFTEASFQMPTNDVTVDYELVRDMGYKVAFSGVPTRARLAKDGEGKFHFADGLTFQLLDNIDAANPKDITSAEGITFMVGEMVPFDMEGTTFYQLDKETLVPLADFLADAHLGNYAICAVASTGEYDGSFSSGMMTLFQGYEVTVGAGEYATFYKDENLYTEDEDAELYTIASVTESEAVLSDAITVAPAETPLLVYNKSEQDKTFLLIPTTDDADEVTPATQFVGTLEATTIPASATGADNYALNGYAFVWVKNAIEVGANKCWLHIASQHAAARAVTRSIVGGNGTTGIDAIENVTIDNEGWYDLQGRKLQSAPNRKGIYIHNGKKVVVRK